MIQNVITAVAITAAIFFGFAWRARRRACQLLAEEYVAQAIQYRTLRATLRRIHALTALKSGGNPDYPTLLTHFRAMIDVALGTTPVESEVVEAQTSGTL